MVIDKRIIDYLIDNKIAIWFTKKQDSIDLAKAVNYSPWEYGVAAVGKYEVFITKDKRGISFNWQDGYQKKYFTTYGRCGDSMKATKCIDFKDIFTLLNPSYELW